MKSMTSVPWLVEKPDQIRQDGGQVRNDGVNRISIKKQIINETVIMKEVKKEMQPDVSAVCYTAPDVTVVEIGTLSMMCQSADSPFSNGEEDDF